MADTWELRQQKYKQSPVCESEPTSVYYRNYEYIFSSLKVVTCCRYSKVHQDSSIICQKEN